MWTAEEALKHHGILGQKWGKKNGPPYPLGASDHSASEKKAGYQKSIKGGSSDSEKKEHKGLTDKQKKYLKLGAIAVGSTLVVAGGVALAKSDQLDKIIHRGKNELSKQGIIQIDLQKFAKPKNRPFKYRSKKEAAIVNNAFSKAQVSKEDQLKPYLIKDVNIDDKGAYRYMAVNQDGYGTFKVIARLKKIKESSTKVLERNPYVKNK